MGLNTMKLGMVILAACILASSNLLYNRYLYTKDGDESRAWGDKWLWIQWAGCCPIMLALVFAGAFLGKPAIEAAAT